MIFGIQTELFEDQAKRKILYVKSTGRHYLLEGKDVRLAKLFQTNIINAVTLSMITGLFVKWSPILYLVIAAAIYFGYLLYFNQKILPRFQQLHDHHIKRKEVERQSTSQLLIQAFAFFLVGIGLFYCVVTGQVGEELPEIAVVGAAVFSLILGAKQLSQSFMKL